MSERYVIDGTVGIVYEKNMGGYSLFSLKLEDDPTWYRLGKNDLRDELPQGSVVEFEYDMEKGQALVDISTIEVLEAAEEETYEEATASAAPGNPGKAASNGDHGSWARKDLRMSRLGARNTAVAVTELLLENGAIELPAKTRVAERHEVLLGFIDNLTVKYFNDTIATRMEDYDLALEEAEDIDYIDPATADDEFEEFEGEDEYEYEYDDEGVEYEDD